jgi:predicted membrane channel-forming protein YqfA (hemolysin III family)
VFGYHEIFHVLVIAAATVQYIAVAVYALPSG